MKKIIYIIAASLAFLLMSGEADAQMGKRHYVNGGWQFNGTVANGFAETAQGYGAYMEGGYYISPMVAFGGFAVLAAFLSGPEFLGLIYGLDLTMYRMNL